MAWYLAKHKENYLFALTLLLGLIPVTFSVDETRYTWNDHVTQRTFFWSSLLLLVYPVTEAVQDILETRPSKSLVHPRPNVKQERVQRMRPTQRHGNAAFFFFFVCFSSEREDPSVNKNRPFSVRGRFPEHGHQVSRASPTRLTCLTDLSVIRIQTRRFWTVLRVEFIFTFIYFFISMWRKEKERRKCMKVTEQRKKW